VNAKKQQKRVSERKKNVFITKLLLLLHSGWKLQTIKFMALKNKRPQQEKQATTRENV
jgi:type II secretory pathway component PulF